MLTRFFDANGCRADLYSPTNDCARSKPLYSMFSISNPQINGLSPCDRAGGSPERTRYNHGE